jgi:hypothetical protein
MFELWRVRDAVTRSVSAENPTGEPGQGGAALAGVNASAARDLGRGWKVSPYVQLAPGNTYVVADLKGPGTIQHIWFARPPGADRSLVLRMWWDGEGHPSVEVPFGDFFCSGWNVPTLVNSFPVAVNPNGGYNSYWPMPFREAARIAVESRHHAPVNLFYQVTYELSPVPDDAAYFHAAWRRSHPTAHAEPHVIIDGVRGRGHYVGTYLAWQSNSAGWWGEGEVKFYLDGDAEFPTICGTGTEDYFGGAWCFEQPEGVYREYSTPFLGMPQAITGTHTPNRFGMYRWHVPDPVHFRSDLRVTVQALGWRLDGRYLPLRDDISSAAFWYQCEPHASHPPLGDIEVV